MTYLIVLSLIVLLWQTIELIIIIKNRKAFEFLILEFNKVCQRFYNELNVYNKKMLDNSTSLSKTAQTMISIKNDVNALKDTIKELQGTSKFLKAGILKEFKDIESAIKSMKVQLKSEK
jgi:hypothetical protein